MGPIGVHLVDGIGVHVNDLVFKRRPTWLYLRDSRCSGYAVREAKRLLEKAVIKDYFIVGPEDHPVYRQSTLGDDLREEFVATAEDFNGAEYSWGGTTVRDGFDCSGLVRAVYQLNGLTLNLVQLSRLERRGPNRIRINLARGEK